MKVLFVAPYLRSPSGWRTLSCGIMQSMERVHQVEPHLVIAPPDVDAAESLLPNVPTTVLPIVQDFSPRMWRILPRWIQSWWRIQRSQFNEVALVHSLEAYPTGLIGHWLAKKLSCPHVMTIAGTYGVMWHQNWVDRMIYGRVLNQANFLCPISKGTQTRMRHRFGTEMAATPSEVNLLGTPSFTKNKVDGLPRDAHHTNNPKILSVAMLKQRKGFHHSIQAFGKIKKQFPKAEYHIIGSLAQKGYVRKLQKLIEQHQIMDVYFHGRVSTEALEKAYQDAALFILTPVEENDHFEGFGFVYIEAGAYGCPVVGTQHGGVPDAIKHGETGLLVPEGDIDQISEAVVDLLSNPEKRQAMGQANKQWSAELSWKRYADQQFRVYQSCLSSN